MNTLYIVSSLFFTYTFHIIFAQCSLFYSFVDGCWTNALRCVVGNTESCLLFPCLSCHPWAFLIYFFIFREEISSHQTLKFKRSCRLGIIFIANYIIFLICFIQPLFLFLTDLNRVLRKLPFPTSIMFNHIFLNRFCIIKSIIKLNIVGILWLFIFLMLSDILWVEIWIFDVRTRWVIIAILSRRWNMIIMVVYVDTVYVLLDWLPKILLLLLYLFWLIARVYDLLSWLLCLRFLSLIYGIFRLLFT